MYRKSIVIVQFSADVVISLLSLCALDSEKATFKNDSEKLVFNQLPLYHEKPLLLFYDVPLI